MNGRAWSPEDTDTLKRMNVAGHTDAEIAEKTGHAAITVFYRRNALGLPRAKREPGSRLRFKYKTAAYS